MTRPSAAIRRQVIQRADSRCEYCLIHQDDAASHHQIDHVLSEKHGGQTVPENLALSCLTCNRRKASDIGAIDPQTGRLTPLFNPRTQTWPNHFRHEKWIIIGITPEGRATVEFLQLNLPERLAERTELIRAGRYAGDA